MTTKGAVAPDTGGASPSTDRRFLSLVPLTVILVIMFVLNRLAPMMADDFCYAASGVAEVWRNTIQEYFTWNDRAVAHLIGPLFTLTPSWVFDLANTAVFGLLLVLMVVLARGSGFTYDDLSALPMAAFFLLCFGIPDFGQTMLWQMGSANYLWTITIILAFLIPFRYLFDGIDLLDSAAASSVLFPIFAVASGWTNENTAATALLLAMTAVIVVRWRKQPAPVWAVAALVGHAIGLAMMVMSPAHHVRMARPVFQAWGELPWIKKAVQFAPNMLRSFSSSWILWLVLLGCVVGLVRRRSTVRTDKSSGLLFALAIAAFGVLNNLVLVMAPTSPPRAMTGGAVYLTIAVLVLLPKAWRVVMPGIASTFAAIVGIWLTLSVVTTMSEYSVLHRLVIQREHAVMAARASGASNIVLDPIVMRPSRHMYWRSISDIRYDPSQWPNTCYAPFLGVELVRLTTPLEDNSAVSLGVGTPIDYGDGVTIEDVRYSETHACLAIIVSSSYPQNLTNTYFDLRIFTDETPTYRKAMDFVRRKFFPETTSDDV